jgi:hypothetical protein
MVPAGLLPRNHESQAAMTAPGHGAPPKVMQDGFPTGVN